MAGSARAAATPRAHGWQGYPQGLKGEEITLKARIVMVADVVEAMSSHRPYRPALGIEQALAEIGRGRGTAFDADVTDAAPSPVSEESLSIAEVRIGNCRPHMPRG